MYTPSDATTPKKTEKRTTPMKSTCASKQFPCRCPRIFFTNRVFETFGGATKISRALLVESSARRVRRTFFSKSASTSDARAPQTWHRRLRYTRKKRARVPQTAVPPLFFSDSWRHGCAWNDATDVRECGEFLLFTTSASIFILQCLSKRELSTSTSSYHDSNDLLYNI